MDCGAPLMNNFLDVANDLLRRWTFQDKRTEFEKVFNARDALQAVHSKAQINLNNIESLFTALELGKVIQRFPGLDKQQIPETINALKDLIAKTLEVTIKFPVKEGKIGIPKSYDKLARLISYLEGGSENEVVLITFNYDMAADMALYLHGQMGPDYVFGDTIGRSPQVPLLKLHGSLNWAIEKDTRKIIPLELFRYFTRYGDAFQGPETSLPISSRLVDYFLDSQNSVEVEDRPLIVPPSWNKSDYHTALTDIWASAADHLSEAEYIFVIGYSLPETDAFFRNLWALGSKGRSPLRQFVVFDPDKTVDRRYQKLLGPGALAVYKFFQEGFDKAIGIIHKDLYPRNRFILGTYRPEDL